MTPELRAVSKLHLDSENPRLPLELLGKPERKILEYLYNTANLLELGQSMADNSYFEHEPLIVIERGGKTIVAEGNRRLATLLILLEDPRAGTLRFPDISLSAKERSALSNVPVFQFPSDHDVFKSLGFRHIGGIRTWSSEAKARYLFREVEDAVKASKSEDPFSTVARRVGLDKQSVRSYYLAHALLDHASSEYGIDTARLYTHDERRFGVWLRAMTTPDVREHMGLGETTTYQEIKKSVRKTNKQNVAEVINDIAPKTGLATVLPDSRKVTTYGRVLRNKLAYAEMRRTESLDTAAVIIEQGRLPVRLEKAARTIALISDEVLDLSNRDAKELVEPAKNVLLAAERLQKAVRGALA